MSKPRYVPALLCLHRRTAVCLICAIIRSCPITHLIAPAVNVYLPKDRVTNQHQQYGFVEFRSEEDADYVSMQRDDCARVSYHIEPYFPSDDTAYTLGTIMLRSRSVSFGTMSYINYSRLSCKIAAQAAASHILKKQPFFTHLHVSACVLLLVLHLDAVQIRSKGPLNTNMPPAGILQAASAGRIWHAQHSLHWSGSPSCTICTTYSRCSGWQTKHNLH